MKLIPFLISFSLMIFSCAPKVDKIVAIDVLLTPSEEMNAQSLHLNRLINQNNPETIKLDKNHIPHITLLQCYINEEDLSKVNQALVGVFGEFKNDSLRAESLFYSKDTEDSFAMIAVEKNQKLLNLHEKVIELVKPYVVFNGNQESFVQNSDGSAISESTVTYVPAFIEKYSYENFDPHISLGVAQTVLLDSLADNVFKPILFKPTSMSVYHLGDHGTAQKLLWKFE